MDMLNKFLVITPMGIVTSNSDNIPAVRGNNLQFFCKNSKIFSFVHG